MMGKKPVYCANCPLREDTARLAELGQDMTRYLRKLRRDLRRCASCEAGPECPILQEYHAVVEAAIDQVVREWGLK